AQVDVDLNGLEIGAATSKSTLVSDRCLRIRAGTYGVIARNADTTQNGGGDNVPATFSFGLGNSGATPTLRANDKAIDTITYKNSTRGVALQRDPKKLAATPKDAPLAFCFATPPYGTGGSKGPPGAANVACPPVVGANECLDPANGQPRAIR